MAKYCPINSGRRCLGNDCSFSTGDGGCLFKEALKNYNRINSPLMSFYIDEKGEPNPREAE